MKVIFINWVECQYENDGQEMLSHLRTCFGGGSSVHPAIADDEI
jgi:hypothetical protein